jgi:4-amino-4-deoxy-L-arabinose transferase-like glycosyltransferase
MVAPFTWSVQAATTEKPNVALPTANTADTTSTTFMTPNNDTMTSKEEMIMEYLLANTAPDSYLLATLNARGAAPYILETGRPVLTFGGFTGSDQVIDAAGLAQMVSDGELRFVLFSVQISRSHPDIARWVQQTCTPVDVPGLNMQPSQPPSSRNVGLPSPPQNEVLYDCGG